MKTRTTALVLLIVCAGLAKAQTLEPPSAPVAEAPSPAPDRPSQLPRRFYDDAKAVLTAPAAWDGEDWKAFGLASAAVLGTALILDTPVHDAVVRHRGAHPDDTPLELLGIKGSLATAAGFYLTGWIGDMPEARATGADALSASLASGLLVGALKFTIGRARPDEGLGPAHFEPFSGKKSFPSGHTTQGFTVAAVIAAHYPDTWVQLTCYGLATLSGLSRIGQDEHWTSDVLAGALIGTTVGRAVVRMNQRTRVAGPGHLQVSFVPDLRPGYRGLQLGLTF